MKIAIISDVVYPWVKGGGEKRYYELGRRLVKSGNEVHYFTMHWEGMPDWEFEHEGMKIHCVCEAPLLDKFYVEGRRGIIKSILFSLHLFKKMFGYGRFDVIECNEFPFFHCFTAKLASTLGYGKLFITWHEVWGTYWYDYIGAKGIFGRVIEAITPFLAHRIISVSEFTKKKLVSVLNVPANRIDVVHNGVDVEQIRRINVEKEHNKIVSVGRLIKEKRVDLLLELFSKIVMNNKNAVLSIVGDGPELESLKSISCKLELEHNVIFRGFIPEYDEVIREMKSSMVMVSLSKREGFGMTIVESLVGGTPVIVADSEEKPDPYSHCIITKESEIANKIADVMNSDVMVDSERIGQMYNWEKLTKELVDVYKS